MTDPEEIAHALQKRYIIDEAGETRLLDSLPFDSPASNQPETLVSVVQLRSLVDRGKGSMPATSYLVPSFAVHWGLVIRNCVFHLRYFPNVPEKGVCLMFWGPWKEDMKKEGHEVKVIGTTRYNIDQLIAIGEALVESFGDYHSLFWNCQTFTKIFLKKICSSSDVNLTSLEVTQPVLCCFGITAPFSSRTAKYEKDRINTLIKRVEIGSDENGLRLDVASQATIDFLQYMIFIEPANQALLHPNDGNSTWVASLISRYSSRVLACTHGIVWQLG